jgi:serine/threonine-protein kinase
MDKNRWQQIENIVDTALTLSEEKRTEYIEEKCAGDAELKSSVTELLESIEASEGYLENPEELQKNLINNFAIQDEKASSMIGEKIGPYKLVELIGHGGMGSIFVAERVDHEFNQKVALKLIRRGMDTPSNIARFKLEQSILADLNHANIAQLYDGGITEERLPYLVMEYVDGTPIDRYCRKKELSIPDRIQLFKAVCKAVQHAHNNLIVHRDLKPENILVKENGEVKILDFGIAKLLEPDVDHTIFQTQTGGRVLTLGYAAPEQLSGENITVNTDIYALGVLLYKLLTDLHPFDIEDKSIREIESIIKKEDPAKPSSRKNSQKPLDGDLDAIILKAMRKEASGRYNSAGEFLDDLQRYEKGLPVLAHEGTTAYRFKKFIKRNKQAIAAAVIFLLSITGLTAFYTFQLAQERNQAQLEAQKAQNVKNLLVDIFEANDPISGDAETATLPKLLEEGTSQILEREIEPSVKLELLFTLGTIYQNITEFDKAEQLANESLRLSSENFGPNSVNAAKSYIKLGGIDYDLGNYEDAKKDLLKANSILADYQPKSDPVYTQLYNHLGYIEEGMSNYDSSRIYFQNAFENIKKQARIDSAKYIEVLRNVGRSIHRTGDYEKADSLMFLALDTSEKFNGENDAITASIAGDIGMYYMTRAKYDSSRILYQRSLDIKEELYGEKGHPNYSATLVNLGVLEATVGNYAVAESLFLKSLKMDEEIFGSDHPYVAISKGHLAKIYLKWKKLDKARELREEQLQVYLDSYGPDHYCLARFFKAYGELLSAQGDYNKAETQFRKSEKIFSSYETTPEDSFAKLYEARGKNYFRLNKFEAAAKQFDMAAKIFNPSRYDEYKIRGAKCLIKLFESYFALGQTEEAEKTFDEIETRIDTTEILANDSEIQKLYAKAEQNLKAEAKN